MRFPSRLVLAGSVLGMFAAGSGTVLLMPEPVADPVVPIPEIAAAAEPQLPTPADAQSPEAPGSTGPAVTGAQIASLALAPARDRAAELVAERARAAAAAAAADEADSDGSSEGERWRELRDELREACDDGRIRGAVCRGA